MKEENRGHFNDDEFDNVLLPPKLDFSAVGDRQRAKLALIMVNFTEFSTYT